MADRMKNQVMGSNRPMSIDEMNSTGIMLQSTNDSRIHEMLPTLAAKQQQIFNETRVGGFG